MNIGMYRPNFAPDVTNTAEETAVLQGLAVCLKAGDSKVSILDEVQRHKFSKNILWVNSNIEITANLSASSRNAVFGTCSALIQCSPISFVSDEAIEAHVLPQLRAMMMEIIAIGRAMGFDEEALPLNVVEHALNTTKIYKSGNTHRPSTLLDRENGRPMEVEVIIGELVRSAREHQVDAPVRHAHNCLQVVKTHVLNSGWSWYTRYYV